ncbi:MAG: folate-binding protein [Pseudomonadota bacterium]
MTDTFTTVLDDRAVLAIDGDDARMLLQGLVTVDLDRLGDTGHVFGALLAPQGKIQFDFFIHAHDGRLLIDMDRDRASDFLKRMMLYKLRSDVTLADVSDTYHVRVSWGAAPIGTRDARLAALGTRDVVEGSTESNATPDTYHAHRMSLGVPEAGKDFSYDDIFPHDAMLDALKGVDFDKGCYVGQEVVSRMQHRGTARKRFFHVEAAASLPAAGEAVESDGKPIGTLGGSLGSKGLALVRTDRLEAAQSSPHVSDLDVIITEPDYFTSFKTAKSQ